MRTPGAMTVGIPLVIGAMLAATVSACNGRLPDVLSRGGAPPATRTPARSTPSTELDAPGRDATRAAGDGQVSSTARAPGDRGTTDPDMSPDRGTPLAPGATDRGAPATRRSPAAQAPAAQPTHAVSPAADPATLVVGFVPIADGLRDPVAVTSARDGSGRLFVAERNGRIRIVRDGAVEVEPFLDIRDRVESGASEQGLLGLAFHPQYARTGALFVCYTTSRPERLGARDAGAVVYARFAATTDPDRADPDSEQVVIWWEHARGNHNGGHLAFGPLDGYLYLGTGDGGGGGDPDDNGQDPTTLLGKMLRLDVDGATPYAIPTTNPHYAWSSRRNEVWALGLRNPWRYSFDRWTGDLYIADVGQSALEEVDFQPSSSAGGENYGWNTMEGTRCYEPSDGCDRTGLTLPIAEYGRDDGCAVTGGYVYRGRAFPRLAGTYFYTDWCTGRTWGLSRGADGQWRSAQIGRIDGRVQSYGEDDDGELYVVTGDGALLHLVDRTPPEPGGP